MGSPNKEMAYVHLPTQKTRLEVRDRDTSVASKTSTYFSTRTGVAIANVFKLPLISPEDKAKFMLGTVVSPRNGSIPECRSIGANQRQLSFGSN